jgi:streptogramin lyase
MQSKSSQRKIGVSLIIVLGTIVEIILAARLLFGLQSGIPLSRCAVSPTAHPLTALPHAPSGTIQEFCLPMVAVNLASNLSSITKGPDGSLWFTETDGNNIGRLSFTYTYSGRTPMTR